MKNKLMKVMGVVLTLAILSGLLIMAVPVSTSAADLSWTNVIMPQLVEAANANVYAVAKDGKTIYLYGNLGADPVAGVDSDKLQKSTDGGLTWVKTSLDTGTVKLAGKVVKFLEVDNTNASNLLAATATDLYRSTNGGYSFSLYNPTNVDPNGAFDRTGGTTLISSIAITSTTDGIYYLVSYADDTSANGGVAMYNPADGAWLSTWDDTLGTAVAWNAYDAFAVAFSPNFQSDGAILAVAGDGTEIYARGLLINAGNDWNATGDLLDVTLTPAVANSGSDTIAALALPSNFGTNSSVCKYFVGLGSIALGNPSGVYRIAPKGNASNKSVLLDSNVNVFSMDYKGTISSGTLAVGQINSKDVSAYTNAGSAATSSAIESTSSVDGKSPTGDNTTPNVKVVFSPDTASKTLFAGTEGACSALAVSTNYTSFNEIAFIKVSDLDNVVLSNWLSPGNPGSQITYATLKDTQGTLNPPGPPGAPTANDLDDIYMLFQSIDKGATWVEIFSSNIYQPAINFTVSATMTYKDDQTIYLVTATPFGTSDYQKKFWKTSDGGNTWDYLYTVNSIQATSMAVIDANNYWIGSSAGIRRSDTTTTAILSGGEIPFIMITIPGFFVCYTFQGQTYVSTDMGVSFTATNDLNITKKATTFDVGKKTLYLMDSSYNIQQYVVGKDTNYSIYKTLTVPADLTATGVASMSIANGIWYFGSSGNVTGQIWKSTDLKTFKAVPGSSKDGLGGTKGNIPGAGIQYLAGGPPTGPNTIYTQSTATDPNKYPAKAWVYNDTFVNGPTVTAPADKSTVGTTVTLSSGVMDAVDFSWSAIPNAKTYEWAIAYDVDFNNPVSLTTGVYTTDGTSVTAVYLLAGKTYYFRVRAIDPLYSNWSAPISFNTMITSDVNMGINAPGRISPENGASGVVLQPALTWGAVTGATYDFKLATDSAFTQVVESKDGLTTTLFSPAAALKPNTTYFWEVRAVAGSNVGTWVQSAFTTAVPPTGATVPPSSPQPPQTVVVTVLPASPAAPPAINVPPAQVTVAPANITVNPTNPETPAYIWIIIAIGAVLVIAVIVLIARTRRV